jgi:hypothetical protein
MPTHFPVAGSQVTVLHSVSGELLQSLGVPTQLPTTHLPLTVQLSFTGQAMPSFAGAELHVCVSS